MSVWYISIKSRHSPFVWNFKLSSSVCPEVDRQAQWFATFSPFIRFHFNRTDEACNVIDRFESPHCRHDVKFVNLRRCNKENFSILWRTLGFNVSSTFIASTSNGEKNCLRFYQLLVLVINFKLFCSFPSLAPSFFIISTFLFSRWCTSLIANVNL